MAYISIVSQMSANTTPSPFVASASTVYGDRAAYRAFDGSAGASNQWMANTTTGTLKIYLGTGYVVTKYIVTEGGEAGATARTCKNWTLQGSNNDSTWTTLSTQTNQAFTLAEEKEYLIASPASYSYYQLVVTANNGDANYMSVGELELYEGGDVSGGAFLLNFV